MRLFRQLHPFWLRLLVVTGVMASAFVATAVVNPFINGQTMVVLLSGATFAALYGGLWLGLGAAVLGALGHNFFFQPPGWAFGFGSRRDVVDLVLFLVMAGMMSWVGAALRDARIAAERSRSEAQDAAEAMEKTLALISHDVRNPLTAARTTAELMLRFGVADEKDRVMTGRIVEYLNRIDRMIQGLLDIHRIRGGKGLVLQFENCDLTETVARAIRDLGVVHGGRLRLVAAAAVAGRWSVDGIRRALENLVNNAAKYGYPDSPVTVVLEDGADHVTLSVHNEGKPIPLSEQAALFAPFYRTPDAERSRAAGWGIGLAVVKGVAEAHGGRVSVDSTGAEGTTFSIRLPKLPTPPAERSSGRAAS
jgi:signal transduction histidine kinase